MKTLGPALCVLFLVGIACGGRNHRGRYCPKKSDNVCIWRNNKCCSEDDCDYGEFCCDENCGNICAEPVPRPTNGERVDDPNCQLGIPERRYCPKKSDILCIWKNNKCCSDEDCGYGEFCCDENCGNTCAKPVQKPTNGERVDDPNCQLGTPERRFCPQKSDIVCIWKNNKCCSDENCGKGEFCCDENCGNTCHKPVPRPTNGERVDDPNCQLGPPERRYCPKKSDILCIWKNNKCCSDEDCGYGDFCCDEYCGNTCAKPVQKPTNGERVDDPNCQLGTPERQFCPQKSDIVCIWRNNKCCSDEDCGYGEFCCDENCGNTCTKPVPRHTNGERVDDPNCQLGIPEDYCPAKPNIHCYVPTNECCSDDDCCYGDICCQENCGLKCRTPVKRKTNGTRAVYDSRCEIDDYE